MIDADILFQHRLLAKYNAATPRYTSYPTAVQFREDFDVADYARAAADPGAADTDLSLYFHIPFCSTACFYCACSKIATKNRARTRPYLDCVKRELALQAERFDTARPVTQLHWGGGTPTFLSPGEMIELMAATREHFTLLPDDVGEYSIEIDPREVSAKTIVQLRTLGFNRLSLGVQDFDPLVQHAINRIQPLKLTADVMRAARSTGFHSISVDLIYGLPYQTAESFARTLDITLSLAPDRLSVFGYAHLPQLFTMQRQMDASTLPSRQERLALLRLAVEKLTSSGYVYVGMDHFALPTDELARAQARRALHRNFQGYSTNADCDLIGLGMSSISKVGDVYAQNAKDLASYSAAINTGRLAIARGICLTVDDRLRRDVIAQLMCNFELCFVEFEATYGICFANVFAPELERLREFERDGLIAVDSDRLQVLAAGRMLVLDIAMVFDHYVSIQT
ncbi:oxygen-independent coproporphyrinogen-3 oxidase [Trinickia symbiotica]|uniref:Coproporphyrinogen-III oxidase n=1 Tax=Trinickia symbiotica TaxID=863227 RepID=A0A2N7WPC2_9BURK|nr:oxygen-independent coproporphyrinogen III oxidase [Trinickia symbiotica]PMS31259.1 oxygen-independent coproporphyrinogen III oxidase [Trinickia symbiotica]PPK41713.1 oxygen-independent coproporphyrinogen-3 oxidase [Trinickia symbiotica]